MRSAAMRLTQAIRECMTSLRRPATPPPDSRRRLRLEPLEARDAPAVNIWVGPQNGLWSNAANWSLRHSPIASDSLVFSGPGTAGRNTNSVNDLRSVTVAEVRCQAGFTATITIGANTTLTTRQSSTFTGQLF